MVRWRHRRRFSPSAPLPGSVVGIEIDAGHATSVTLTDGVVESVSSVQADSAPEALRAAVATTRPGALLRVCVTPANTRTVPVSLTAAQLTRDYIHARVRAWVPDIGHTFAAAVQIGDPSAVSSAQVCPAMIVTSDASLVDDLVTVVGSRNPVQVVAAPLCAPAYDGVVLSLRRDSADVMVVSDAQVRGFARLSAGGAGALVDSLGVSRAARVRMLAALTSAPGDPVLGSAVALWAENVASQTADAVAGWQSSGVLTGSAPVPVALVGAVTETFGVTSALESRGLVVAEPGLGSLLVNRSRSERRVAAPALAAALTACDDIVTPWAVFAPSWRVDEVAARAAAARRAVHRRVAVTAVAAAAVPLLVTAAATGGVHLWVRAHIPSQVSAAQVQTATKRLLDPAVSASLASLAQAPPSTVIEDLSAQVGSACTIRVSAPVADRAAVTSWAAAAGTVEQVDIADGRVVVRVVLAAPGGRS